MCQARHKEEVAAEWLQCQNIGGHDLESLTRRSQPLIRLLAGSQENAHPLHSIVTVDKSNQSSGGLTKPCTFGDNSTGCRSSV
jgi:hypothetical protein